jgi:acetylornithine/N-succinyldiaminopimelate aminotransferase
MNDRELFYRHLGLPSFEPMDIHIVKAEGIWLTDDKGKRYMDLVSGISVSNIGHRHPEVLEAIKNQLDQYLYLNVYGEFVQSPQVQLAEKLSSLLPDNLDAVYFVNSGSEAIEGAMKLAKRYTGRAEIIAFKNAYHGSTHGALSILGHESLKQAYRPLLPGIRLIRYNEESELQFITKRSAAVVVETVQAEAGIQIPDPGYLSTLRKRCDETGTLLVIDDVQMGFGRTGKLFSFEHEDIVPDILVLAKALGAGMPLGAFIAPKKVMDTLAFDPELGHITTFGGHPVSCAAALAGLNVLINGGWIAQAEEKGAHFEDRLKHHPAIAGIRRKGLALGLDLKHPEKRAALMQTSLDHGVITDWYLFMPATFRIAPPLNITTDEIDEACTKFEDALDAL